MKFNMFASLAVLFGCGVAQAIVAPAVDSEYFHQAPAGVSEVRPHLTYRSITQKPTGATTGDITQKGVTDLGARYEYGLNEMLSFYGDLSVSMLENKNGNNSANTSGLDDIEIGMRGNSAMGMGSLRYGLAANLGLEKRKVDSNGNQSNNSSGGIGFMPYVGWDMTAGPGFWGARLSYSYLLERTIEQTGNEGKLKDGNVLGLGTFYEYLLSDMILGARLQYDMTADSKVTSSGTETTVGTDPMFTVGVYTRIPMGPGVLLAGLDYMTLSGKKFGSNVENADSRQGFDLNLGYRIAF